MGMRSGIYGNGGSRQPVTMPAGAKIAGYASGGTSSFPVTGFPASAYLGNNRRLGNAPSQPSSVANALGNIGQLDNLQVIIVIAVVIMIGVTLWHLDNK